MWLFLLLLLQELFIIKKVLNKANVYSTNFVYLFKQTRVTSQILITWRISIKCSFDSLVQSQKICIFRKLPDDANATDCRTLGIARV